MNVLCHEFDLPLKHTFRISREAHNIQPTFVVELVEEGQHGFGEATTNSYYGITTDSMRGSLENVRQRLESASLTATSPEDLWASLAEELSDDPFTLCAIDQAANDLWGKLQGKPLHKLWGLSLENLPASCYTIGIDSIDVMRAKLNEVPGWPVYKIKLGTNDDIAIIKALRDDTDAVFRVDANCGWKVEEAIDNSHALKELNVEFIEQPLTATRWDDHRRLFEASALPILADESCLVESDVAKCEGHFHGVNIKLVKCGGLTPARRMIADAKARGLSVMVGCMTESTVGISAIAQLLPMLDYVDMDGAELLSEDIATGAKLNLGICKFPSGNGSGVQLH